jgi:YD repeat-containing protein
LDRWTTFFVYDSVNRHVRTVAPNGIGGTVTITYTRDALDRIISRTSAGSTTTAASGTFEHAFSNTDDNPDIDLRPTGKLIGRSVSLPGGVLYTKTHTTSSNSRWHYPNIHGDIIVTLKSDATPTVPSASTARSGSPSQQQTPPTPT